ncbi:5-formyltetrahydrofolate cyclo-ligase (fragment) [Bradyrhizobium sp. STM 3843]
MLGGLGVLPLPVLTGPRRASLALRGWGEGQAHDRCELSDLYPLTRIASDDAIRPLPASGER